MCFNYLVAIQLIFQNMLLCLNNIRDTFHLSDIIHLACSGNPAYSRSSFPAPGNQLVLTLHACCSISARYKHPLQSPASASSGAGFRLSVNTCARVIWPFSTSKCSSTPPQVKRSSSRWRYERRCAAEISQLLAAQKVSANSADPAFYR